MSKKTTKKTDNDMNVILELPMVYDAESQFLDFQKLFEMAEGLPQVISSLKHHGVYITDDAKSTITKQWDNFHNNKKK